MRQAASALVLALVVSWSGGCAQPEGQPKIEVIDIQPVLLTDKGTSVGESEVTYSIEFVPQNAVRAEIQVKRGDEVVNAYPAPMKAGINKVKLPSGLQMENPSDLILAQVSLPDGRLSESSGRVIYDAADFEKRDARAKALFNRIVPEVLTGRRAQTVRILGTDLAAMAGSVT